MVILISRIVAKLLYFLFLEEEISLYCLRAFDLYLEVFIRYCMKVSITWKEIVHACRRRKADCVMKWIVHCLLDSVTLANLLVFLSLVSETWQWFQFFQQIADGQRELIESYSIKKRHFIGNTSMDACLSFIMANHGRVKPNDIVYDPFVGTGTFVYFSTGRKKTWGIVLLLALHLYLIQQLWGPDWDLRSYLRQNDCCKMNLQWDFGRRRPTSEDLNRLLRGVKYTVLTRVFLFFCFWT